MSSAVRSSTRPSTLASKKRCTPRLPAGALRHEGHQRQHFGQVGLDELQDAIGHEDDYVVLADAVALVGVRGTR